ncbi:tRNA nuclease WapA precursor [Novipirellula aureliae]|uniref:tRNA nuclease WapA n=1 Tax=Novipirellula aureliae TaxID=2527966 RepID=A0A5C6DP11_9BACT|nr:tRNA nuclease WapA precursor [Novipirellula aureliae]
MKERYAYDAYGTPTISDASGTTLTTTSENNRSTYTGREWDEDLRLYHYRARMYDPVAGRFCSRDPIGYWDGQSLYRAYFAIAGVDPGGNFAFALPLLPVITAGQVLQAAALGISVGCLLYAPCREAVIEELEDIIENLRRRDPETEPEPRIDPPVPIPNPNPRGPDCGRTCYCCCSWFEDAAPVSFGAMSQAECAALSITYSEATCGCSDGDDCITEFGNDKPFD